LFCDTALAGRIELAEAQLIARASEAARRRAGTAGFVIPIAGGIASFAEAGSPFNKVAGLGFAGVPDASSLDQIERAFAASGARVQVELSLLADPAIGTLLTGRGYRLESFENVLGRALTLESARVMPPGIEIGPSGEEEFETWVASVADGVAHPDTQGTPAHEEFTREAVIAAERDMTEAGVVRYAARRDGIIIGGATMRMTNGVAQLTGAATAPAHRRRGAQTALLSARLADAAAAGCDVAVITTQPGSKSQQNAQRQGFDLLYARAVLVKQVPRSPKARTTTASWPEKLPAKLVRIARPTDRLDDVVRFYRDGLWLPEINRFAGHAGYRGVILGLPGWRYHLEFTQHDHGSPGPAPSRDNLLVLYLGDLTQVGQVASRLASLGHLSVAAENPYWSDNGAVTVEDPDGWRVVLMPLPPEFPAEAGE